jgi:hypothetical protein
MLKSTTQEKSKRGQKCSFIYMAIVNLTRVWVASSYTYVSPELQGE